jgi:hypothetical protein
MDHKPEIDMAITHCLDRARGEYNARDAKEWALAAAVLIDKLQVTNITEQTG